jgi:cobalt/nickel transport system permease protein
MDNYADIDSPMHTLDPRAKILAFFTLIIVSVSTPPDRYFAFAGYLFICIAAAVLSKIPAGKFLKRIAVVIPFVLLVGISLPFIKSGDTAGAAGSISTGIGGLSVSYSGLMLLWNVTIKALVAIMALTIVSMTTQFSDFLKALEDFHVPRIFTMLAGFAHRYIFVLADEFMRMKRARDSRLYGGRWLWHAKVIGGMIGTMFLRSYERAERIYVAMVSRGFDGRCEKSSMGRMRIADYAFSASVIVAAFALRLIV